MSCDLEVTNESVRCWKKIPALLQYQNQNAITLTSVCSERFDATRPVATLPPYSEHSAILKIIIILFDGREKHLTVNTVLNQRG